MKRVAHLFKKVKELTRFFLRQEVDVKRIPYSLPTDVRGHRKKNFSRHGDLVPGIYAPLLMTSLEIYQYIQFT
jgi:hypothetical protein